MKKTDINRIYIGDNLTVMSENILKEYFGNIKMIYIDPPYNTCNRFSYDDSRDTWEDFIRKRVECSKKFLKENGVIFISIDDNEYATLKIICDSIFGKENFVGTFITKQAERSNAKHINTVHEYILSYAKNKNKLEKFQIKRLEKPEDRKIIESLYKDIEKGHSLFSEETPKQILNRRIREICEEKNISWLKNYSNIDENGRIYFAKDLSVPGEPNSIDIPEIGLKLAPLKTRRWSSEKKFIDLYKKNMLAFKDGRPYEKHFLEDSADNVPSVLNFYSRFGTNDLKKLGIGNIFDTPKPVEMIKFLIKISTEENDIVMDFFAGCGTTAQAVYELNEEEKRKNKYVLIQLEEPVSKKSAVYKKCEEKKINPNVADILKFRIDTYLDLNNKAHDYEILR